MAHVGGAAPEEQRDLHAGLEGGPARPLPVLCVATDDEIPPNELGIVERTIAGGRYAVTRHVGPNETLPAAVRYVRTTWLAASPEQARDEPIVLHRVRVFPRVPANRTVTDVLLPLQARA